MRAKAIIYGWLCLLTASFLVGCATKKTEQDVPKISGNIAVASFYQPEQEWEILGGYYSVQEETDIDTKILKELNEIMAKELNQHGVDYKLGPGQVRQCREYVLYKEDTKSMRSTQFWSKIGDCLSAEYILIPQIFDWRERKGGEFGVEKPAKVIFDLILLDVLHKKVIRSFRYEKEQKALSENILNIFKFFQRKGRWITAKRLAKEGIVQGIEELGL